VANMSSVTTQAGPGISDISSLVAFLFSLAALQDWLKLIFIGGALEAIRRTAASTYSKVINAFWVMAYFDEDDSSYSMSLSRVSASFYFAADRFVCSDWMMVWLSKQPNWSESLCVLGCMTQY
jgi:mitochondrial chaperone BCS1